jgi:tryptophanase
MAVLGFTFASFLIIMNREPRFKNIGLEQCKETMCSYPNGLSVSDVHAMFEDGDARMGSVFFKRDSTVFMMDVEAEEDRVVLRHLASNEYDMSRFCNTYFEVRGRVESIGGEFVDGRLDGCP